MTCLFENVIERSLEPAKISIVKNSNGSIKLSSIISINVANDVTDESNFTL